MPYIVDGNNLLGHLSPHKLRDIQSRLTLAARLHVFQKVKRTKVHLVFDGSPDPDMEYEVSSWKALSVLYPEPGSSADRVIKDLIMKQTDRRRLFVVSTDREIRNFTRAKGAKSLSCADFLLELKKAEKRFLKAAELRKDVASPSKLEIEHWIELFRSRQ